MSLLEDLIEEYIYDNIAKGFTEKTIINKRWELGQFKRYMVEKRAIKEIESITTFDIKAYVLQKQKQGLQPQSIVSLLKMVKAFFNWCINQGYIKENLMNKIEMPKVPKKIITGFTANEIGRMIKAFSFDDYIEARNKAIIAILADCGLRSIELRRLKHEDIRDNVVLVNGKGNKQRNVFISPQLKKILIRYERLKKEYFDERIAYSDHYFLTYQGNDLSHMALYDVIKLAGERAGVEGKRISPHTLRHFYAVQSINSGMDVYSLSRLLGHSDISTTQRYLSSMTDAQLKEKAISLSPLANLNKRGN